jgi:hypothetical protein
MQEAGKYLDTSFYHNKGEEQVVIFTRSSLPHEVTSVDESPAIADSDRDFAEA